MLPFQDSLSQRQEPCIQRPQVPQQGSWVTEPDRRLQGPAHLAIEQKGQENPATGPSVQPNWEEGQTDECRLYVSVVGRWSSNKRWKPQQKNWSRAAKPVMARKEGWVPTRHSLAAPSSITSMSAAQIDHAHDIHTVKVWLEGDTAGFPSTGKETGANLHFRHG